METEEMHEAVGEVARALRRLGNGDASTPYGAIEGLAMQVAEIGESIRATGHLDYHDDLAELTAAVIRTGDKILQGFEILAKAVGEKK